MIASLAALTSGLLSPLLALVLTCVLLRALRPVALRIGLVDYPSPRKAHNGAVPLIGGLGMFCGFAFVALTLDTGLTEFRSFFAAAGVLVVIGVLDDFHELSSRSRFTAQIVAALLMVYWGGVGLEDLGALGAGGADFELGRWDVVFTVFATVGVINALNMIDGLDGLAGGLSLVALLGLAWVAHASGRGEELALLVVLNVVVVAFLFYNVRMPGRRQALVFMGDAGSMFLGFSITWFLVSMSQGEQRAMPPVLALWLLMVPLFDTVWLILRRFFTGRSPISADIEHLHHILRMTGMSAGSALWLILLIAAVGAIAGVAAIQSGVAEQTLFYTFLGVFALYCAVMGTAWYTRRLLFWSIDRRVIIGERRTGDEAHESERRSVGGRRETD